MTIRKRTIWKHANPSSRNLSLTSIKWGDVKRPVRKPHSRKIASEKAHVDPWTKNIIKKLEAKKEKKNISSYKSSSQIDLGSAVSAIQTAYLTSCHIVSFKSSRRVSQLVFHPLSYPIPSQNLFYKKKKTKNHKILYLVQSIYLLWHHSGMSWPSN